MSLNIACSNDSPALGQNSFELLEYFRSIWNSNPEMFANFSESELAQFGLERPKKTETELRTFSLWV